MQTHWIFTLRTPLGPEAVKPFESAVNQALSAWQAHGRKVRYAFELRRKRFVFVQALDPASGCGIDWMTQTIHELARSFGVEIAPASEVFYQGKQGVESLSFSEVEAALLEGRIAPHTIVYDATVANAGTFEGWASPLHQTWLQRYVKTAAVA